MSFIDTLKNAGWTEVQSPVSYRKGEWVVYFDTSSWMEVGTTQNQRVFDVPVPEAAQEQWTLNLIEHLCKTDDQISRLKQE